MSPDPGATLTMPGIAGIVNPAVAVDANVLINERIKEEPAEQRARPFSGD
ncbi:hypothetical protein MJ579_06545 [Klebsiella pneumoniae]|nr:hypothetical protein MJ579_06545 [Klebsiella pneumoniae]